MKIYLVRHTESVSNAMGVIGCGETKLTAKGIRDAKKLGKKLAKIKIEAIYCSDMVRTNQTMECFLKAGLKVDQKNIFITDLIREINRDEFTGRSSVEYYQAREKSGINPDDFKCKGGESENDVKKRAIKFVKIINKAKYKSILVISHGHFLKALQSLLKNKDSYISIIIT